MSDYIPDHILIEVVLRLPFDSVCRFRCVSKSWRDLINSSNFDEMRHLIDSSKFLEHCRRRSCNSDQSHSHPDSKIITMVGTKFCIYNSVVKNSRKGYKVIAQRLTSPDMEFKKRGLMLTGSCNGIVCLSNDWTGDFVFWNPFTGSTLYSDELASVPYEFSTMAWPVLQDAFVYDHINDDYKLVRWHVNAAPRVDGEGEDLYELCVYSLKQDSWRTITDAGELNLDASGGYLPEQCAFTNGALHWVIKKFGGHPRFRYILAFDVGTDEFRKIASAPVPATSGFVHINLSVLNGSLCICYSYTHSSRHSVDIWVMKENGVESSWTKLITGIDLPEDHYLSHRSFKAVAYSKKRGKLLLQPTNWGNPVICDLNTKSLKHVAVGIRTKRGFQCQSCVCVGSFISPHLLYWD